mgnify:CR=1 FL=1
MILAYSNLMPLDRRCSGSDMFDSLRFRQFEFSTLNFAITATFTTSLPSASLPRRHSRRCIASPGHLWKQIPDSQQIVGSHHPQEVLPDPRQPSGLRLSEPADLLGPPKRFFHPFANPLADPVARVAGCPSVNRRPAGLLQILARRVV